MFENLFLLAIIAIFVVAPIIEFIVITAKKHITNKKEGVSHALSFYRVLAADDLVDQDLSVGVSSGEVGLEGSHGVAVTEGHNDDAVHIGDFGNGWIILGDPVQHDLNGDHAGA